MSKKLLLNLLLILIFKIGMSQHFVEIGNGIETTYQPTHGGWEYSWMSTMYLASEMDGAKTITQIAFYRGYEDLVQWGANWDVTDQKVYMTTTSDNGFQTNSNGKYNYAFPENPVTGYTKVFEGTYNYGAFGWHVITLDTPFEYNGTDNLIVHWESRNGESTWNLKWTGTNGSGTGPVLSVYAGSDTQFSQEDGYMYLDNARTNVRFYYDGGDIPSTPVNPIPTDNSIKADLSTGVQFTLGTNTTNYDLYFGTDEDALTKVVDNAAATAGDYTYDPGYLLESQTRYYWQAIAKNATASESSPVWSFITEGAITEFPWQEGFQDQWQGISSWWSSIINTNYPDSTDWTWDDNWSYIGEGNAIEDTITLYCSAYTDGEYSLTTPRIVLPADHRVSFWWKNGYLNSKVAGKDTTFFEISTNGGTNWTTLDTLSPAAVMTEWENPIINLDGYEGDNVNLRWRVKHTDGYAKTFLDDLSIKPNPTGATLELNLTEIPFRDVAMNGSTKVEVIIRNTGVVEMDVAGVTVSSPFSCEYSGTIEPGGVDTMDVYFSPGSAGTISETLTVNSNGEGTNTIALSGTGIALKGEFYETFDLVKALPEGWSNIDSPLGYYSGGGVQVITGGTADVSTSPYAVKLYMSGDTINPAVLLTPGVGNFNTSTLNFVAKKYDPMRATDLLVGTMVDPYDATTFVARETIELTDEFEPYSVQFKPTNTAPYIAFMHGGNPTGSDDYTSIRIDNVAWEDGGINEVPLPAILGTPANNAENVDIMNNPVLKWTAGSSNTEGFYVYLGTSSTNYDVIDGLVVGVNPTNLEITYDLDFNTRYYWKIIPYNSNGSCANNSTFSFKTMADPTVSVPWEENFDAVVSLEGNNDRPIGWSIENSHGDITWDILADSEYGTFSNSAPNSIHIGFGFNAKDDYLYTPPINLEAGKSYELSYQVKTAEDPFMGGFEEKLKVYYGTNNTSSAMVNLLSDLTVDEFDYTLVKATITPDTDGTYYVGFYACSDPMYYLIILDDVKIVEMNPEFTSIPVESGVVGSTYTYSIEASDPNDQSLTISATTKPSWLSFTDNGDGTALLLGTPSEAGEYNVVLEATNGAASVTQEYTITVSGSGSTGIDEISVVTGIILAPNPAKSSVNIIAQESLTLPYQVQIINVIGEKVFESFIEDQHHKIDLNSYDSGLYFVVVFDGNEKYTQKLIIR